MKNVAPARFLLGHEMDTWQKKGRSFFNSNCSQVVPVTCSWTKFQLLFLSLDQLILNIKNPFQSTRPTRENPREQIVSLREQHWACFFERENPCRLSESYNILSPLSLSSFPYPWEVILSITSFTLLRVDCCWRWELLESISTNPRTLDDLQLVVQHEYFEG